MPRRSRRSTSVVSMVSTTRRVPVMTTPAPVVVTTVNQNRRRRRTRNRQSRSMALPTAAARYVATLADPFDYGGIKLGFGTMVPSGLGTLFLRTSFTAATDGSFYVAQLPYCAINGNLANILYNNSGVNNTSGATGLNYTNVSAFVGLTQEARIVSMGIKVLPQIAATSVPGAIYAGAIPSLTYGQTASSSPNSFASSPYLKVGYGNFGATACGRPEDPSSFEFSANFAANPASANTLLNYSTPVIAGTGFPASTSIVVECVINFEYLYSFNLSAQALSQPLESDALDTDENLSSLYTNIESLWNRIKAWLPDEGQITAISNMAAGSARAALRSSVSGMIRSVKNNPNASMSVHVRRAAQEAISSASSTIRSNVFGNAPTMPQWETRQSPDTLTPR